ncbi:MAG: hypothetical protein QM771_16145 [Nitrospira sp.]
MPGEMNKPKWFHLILLLAVLATMVLFISLRQRDKESHEESGQPSWRALRENRMSMLLLYLQFFCGHETVAAPQLRFPFRHLRSLCAFLKVAAFELN